MNIMYTSVKLCENVMISDERKKKKISAQHGTRLEFSHFQPSFQEQNISCAHAKTKLAVNVRCAWFSSWVFKPFPWPFLYY